MEVWGVKVIILLTLFAATYVFALLPVWLMRVANRARDATVRRKFDRGISFLSCFAGGVFLSTCLLDIYPDVEDLLRTTIQGSLDTKSKFRDYPFAESVMVIGLFLVLIMEQLVLAVKERSQSQEKEGEHGAILKNANSASNSNLRTRYGSTDIDQRGELNPVLDRSCDFPPPTSNPNRTDVSSSPQTTNLVSEDPEDESVSKNLEVDSPSPIRAFIMLAALSLHSIFEGLAVGLQTTVVAVLSVFGALILHKCIIAFSIGLSLVQSQLSMKKIVTSNAIFCISSPLGIAIGILLIKYQSGFAGNLTSGILQGLACGTFLYVTFFEVMPLEFNKPNDRGLKVLFVILGFIVVNGVVILELLLNKDMN